MSFFYHAAVEVRNGHVSWDICDDEAFASPEDAAKWIDKKLRVALEDLAEQHDVERDEKAPITKQVLDFNEQLSPKEVRWSVKPIPLAKKWKVSICDERAGGSKSVGYFKFFENRHDANVEMKARLRDIVIKEGLVTRGDILDDPVWVEKLVRRYIAPEDPSEKDGSVLLSWSVDEVEVHPSGSF